MAIYTAIWRKTVLVLVLLVCCRVASAFNPLSAETEMALGALDAPVTIIEYASMTCPHCARFHLEELPQIKETYIDTGKVRFVYWEFPLGRLALTAAKIARCGGEERFFGFISLFFSKQVEWAGSNDPVDALRKLANVGGLGSVEFDACLANTSLEDGILTSALAASKAHGIDSTPSFVINGELLEGELTVAKLAEIVAQSDSDSMSKEEPQGLLDRILSFIGWL